MMKDVVMAKKQHKARSGKKKWSQNGGKATSAKGRNHGRGGK